MKTSEPVIGNLPLLLLPPQRVSKLSGQPQWDYMEQLRHQCVRLAWLKSARSGLDLRTTLDLVVGRAFTTYSEVRGGPPMERILEIEMEHSRRENEWWTCFGFLLEGEVEHLISRGVPGPVLRSMLAPTHKPSGPFSYSALLEYLLQHCREHVRGCALARETVQIVHNITGKPSCLRGVPPIVDSYFNLGRLLPGLIDEAVRLNEHPPTQLEGSS